MMTILLSCECMDSVVLLSARCRLLRQPKYCFSGEKVVAVDQGVMEGKRLHICGVVGVRRRKNFKKERQRKLGEEQEKKAAERSRGRPLPCWLQEMTSCFGHVDVTYNSSRLRATAKPCNLSYGSYLPKHVHYT